MLIQIGKDLYLNLDKVQTIYEEYNQDYTKPYWLVFSAPDLRIVVGYKNEEERDEMFNRIDYEYREFTRGHGVRCKIGGEIIDY